MATMMINLVDGRLYSVLASWWSLACTVLYHESTMGARDSHYISSASCDIACKPAGAPRDCSRLLAGSECMRRSACSLSIAECKQAPRRGPARVWLLGDGRASLVWSMVGLVGSGRKRAATN